MLGKKGIALVLVLIVLALFAIGRSRSRLDRIAQPMRESFQDIVYLPRGDALKILAFGFDAPFADALFIKAMIYYSEAVLHRPGQSQERLTGQKYTYELFDVITDLSPRFGRAYQIGSIFLSSAADLDMNRKGQDLLQKGIDCFTKIEANGEKGEGDPRWLFHLLRATTYDMTIAGKIRAAGDILGAAEARQMAGDEFRLAAMSPQAPGYVVRAAVGYQYTAGGDDLFTSGQAMLGVWSELHAEAVRRGDKDLAEELKKRADEANQDLANLVSTSQLEKIFSAAGQRFLSAKGRIPDCLEELAREGFIPAVPDKFPLDTEAEPDRFLVLPDGAFRSQRMAGLEARRIGDYLFKLTTFYRRANKGRKPPDLETLVQEKYLDKIPPLPLAALGQTYQYDPKTGLARVVMPEEEGPEAKAKTEPEEAK